MESCAGSRKRSGPRRWKLDANGPIAPQMYALRRAFRLEKPSRHDFRSLAAHIATLSSTWNLLGCHGISSVNRFAAVPKPVPALHHLVTAVSIKKALMRPIKNPLQVGPGSRPKLDWPAPVPNVPSLSSGSERHRQLASNKNVRFVRFDDACRTQPAKMRSGDWLSIARSRCEEIVRKIRPSKNVPFSCRLSYRAPGSSASDSFDSKRHVPSRSQGPTRHEDLHSRFIDRFRMSRVANYGDRNIGPFARHDRAALYRPCRTWKARSRSCARPAPMFRRIISCWKTAASFSASRKLTRWHAGWHSGAVRKISIPARSASRSSTRAMTGLSGVSARQVAAVIACARHHAPPQGAVASGGRCSRIRMSLAFRKKDPARNFRAFAGNSGVAIGCSRRRSCAAKR